MFRPELYSVQKNVSCAVALVLNPPPVDFRDPAPFEPGGTAGAILTEAYEAVRDGAPVVMREICRSLGLTPGAPYSHFESTAHLEDVIAYNGLLSLARSVGSAVDPTLSPTERLLSASHAYREWATRESALFGFVFPTSGGRRESPFTTHVRTAAVAVAVPTTCALRDGWDAGTFSRPGRGPDALPVEIPGIVVLSPAEARIANALWATVHGTVVLELTMGTHDGWDDRREMFEWMVSTAMSAHLSTGA